MSAFYKIRRKFFAKMQSKPLLIDGKSCVMELITDFTSQLEAEEQLLDSVQELSDYRFALDESCLVLILDEIKR